ncbi:MAG: AI-2E family transporter [Clostridia bacterium]|nr:AI-2E family transporter [Clostridia bacterium]
MRKLNEKYFTVSVYALIVIAFSVLFGVVFLNLGKILGFAVQLLIKVDTILYGILFALLLLPLSNYLDMQFQKLVSKKKPHPLLEKVLSLTVTYLTATVILAITFGALIPAIINNVTDFNTIFSDSLVKMQTWIRFHAENSAVLTKMTEQLYAFLRDNVLGAGAQKLISGVGTIAGVVFSELSNIALGALLSIYLLASRKIISGIVGKSVSAIFNRPVSIKIALFCKRLYTDFCSFATTRLCFSLIFSAVSFVTVLLLDVPLYSLAVLILLVSHIFPVLGSIIGDAVTFLLVLILAGGKAFILLAVLVGTEILLSVFLLPAMLPKRLRPPHGLTALLVILSGGLFGLIGAFLVIPVYSSLKIEVQSLLNRRLQKKKLPIQTEEYANFDFSALRSEKDSEKK